MTKEEMLKIKESRLAKLKENGKNFKCPGVVRKLEREVRNLKAQ